MEPTPLKYGNRHWLPVTQRIIYVQAMSAVFYAYICIYYVCFWFFNVEWGHYLIFIFQAHISCLQSAGQYCITVSVTFYQRR